MVRLTCPIPCYVDGKPWQTDDVDDDRIAFRQYDDHIRWVHDGGGNEQQDNTSASENKEKHRDEGVFEQLR